MKINGHYRTYPEHLPNHLLALNRKTFLETLIIEAFVGGMLIDYKNILIQSSNYKAIVELQREK